MANMDDASRAVKGALELKSKLGDGTHVGVATGLCYCGTVGSTKQCKYVVIG